jgi:protein-tyrosine phosphatase
MIDIHCHVLPDVDDGSKSWEMSLEMCRMAVADGIEHIVATPHANDRYHYDREYLNGLISHLRQLTKGEPNLSLGCDFHVSYENVQAALAKPESFAIEGTQYLLVELSNYSVPLQMEEYFNQFVGLGLTPVITHPERNPILQSTPERVLRWVDLGCIVQVTASAITGFWGERVWRAAEWLLKRNAVHVLATDAHETKHRVPVLSAAREAVTDFYGEEVAAALVDGNPRAIVSGKPIPYLPEVVLKS